MGTVSPEELLKLWQLEKVTVEMAMGHVVQNLVSMHALVKANNTTLHKLRADVRDLLAHSGSKPRSKDKRQD
jgi:hypothetical protein